MMVKSHGKCIKMKTEKNGKRNGISQKVIMIILVSTMISSCTTGSTNNEKKKYNPAFSIFRYIITGTK